MFGPSENLESSQLLGVIPICLEYLFSVIAHQQDNGKYEQGVFVDGLIEQVICNPRDAYQLIIKGWLNRRVALTSMNREGSHSHAVFTVKIESKDQRDRKLPTLTALGSKSPKIEDLNLSFKDYQKIFLQEDSFKKLYAVISKLQQENQNLLEKLIFMNHLENHSCSKPPAVDCISEGEEEEENNLS
ncbi:kinesin protein KIF15 [Biomphalaria glabrata]|nr:kinesin protein KIF15 [Biomphalaria glabrata]